MRWGQTAATAGDSVTVYFYSAREVPYGCFSNFSAHGFEVDGRWWPTSEHYFQAQKFVGTAHEEAVRLAPTPKEAANMARERKRPLRGDWESVQDDVMRRAVRGKFARHEGIRVILLATVTMRLWRMRRAITTGAAARTSAGATCSD